MLPRVNLPALPRMADFAQWGEAVGLGLGWQPGAFLSEYNVNRSTACVLALEDCPVVRPLSKLVDRCDGSYSGTASELIELWGASCQRQSPGRPNGPILPDGSPASCVESRRSST